MLCTTMSRPTTLVLLGLTLFWTVCCATARPSYTILIENSTGQLIRDAHVYWEDFKSIGGSMDPDVWKSHNFIRTPLPPRVMVRWRTPDGVTHREEVSVPEGARRRFRGTLHFELFEDGRVEVRVDS